MEPALRWTSWPARERPIAAIAATVVVLMLIALVATVAASTMVAALAGAGLLAALHRFYLPVHCSIDATDAVVRTAFRTKRFPIRAVRRIAHDGRAMLLTSRKDGVPRATFHGIVMPLPRDGADAIVRDATNLLGGAVL